MYIYTVVLAGNDTFLTETSFKIEKDSKLSQNIWYFDQIKTIWMLMICFCYFYQKQFFPLLGVAHNDPFSVQIGSKKTTFKFKRFYQLFFRTAGLQNKLLILIVYPNIFHWKSAKEYEVGVVFGAKYGPN